MGIDLPHRSAARGQPPRIVVGLQIAHQRRHPRAARPQFRAASAPETPSCPFQGLKPGSAPARRQPRSSPAAPPPIRRSSSEFPAAAPQSGSSCRLLTSPSSISIDSISSSRPWRSSLHGSPQRGQRKLCTPSSSTSCAARPAVHHHRQHVDHQPRALQRRSLGCDSVAELQRLQHHGGQRPHAQPHLEHPRARVSRQRLGHRLTMLATMESSCIKMDFTPPAPEPLAETARCRQPNHQNPRDDAGKVINILLLFGVVSICVDSTRINNQIFSPALMRRWNSSG